MVRLGGEVNKIYSIETDVNAYTTHMHMFSSSVPPGGPRSNDTSITMITDPIKGMADSKARAGKVQNDPRIYLWGARK
jgi:hypothetical protein